MEHAVPDPSYGDEPASFAALTAQHAHSEIIGMQDAGELGPLLEEMQSVARPHPGVTW